MTVSLTRRRFVAIAAAAVCAGPSHAANTARWQGRALGAGASIQLAGVSEARAERVFRSVDHELSRLERMFSLYHDGSDIVRLNATGRLDAPAPEMLEVLTLCDSIHKATAGAFDPTVQPLWLAHATGAAGDAKAARALLGWQHLRFDTSRIEFSKPGMGLTLNGIAQGYITDRISQLLGAHGFGDILIDIGEIIGRGRRADGALWQAGVALPDGEIVHRVTLNDRALATSAPSGTILDHDHQTGHILDPRTEFGAPQQQLVSVSSPKAAIADGLSTAFCLLHRDQIDTTLAHFPYTTLEKLI